MGYYRDALAQLMALNTVQVGAVGSAAMSYASYEYIEIRTK